MIEINNLTETSVEEDFLKRIINVVLKGEKNQIKNLSIALVSPDQIKKINKDYRKKDKATDVLSFSEAEVQEKFPDQDDTIGEIIVCLREVEKNAIKYKSGFKIELARVLIHGTLHLLGYSHENDGLEAKKMKEKQDYYLSQINL